MTKGSAASPSRFVAGRENSRSPLDFAQGRLSTSLRSGRDDNSSFGTVRVLNKNVIPTIKSQARGMTKGRATLPRGAVGGPKVFSSPCVAAGRGFLRSASLSAGLGNTPLRDWGCGAETIDRRMRQTTAQLVQLRFHDGAHLSRLSTARRLSNSSSLPAGEALRSPSTMGSCPFPQMAALMNPVGEVTIAFKWAIGIFLEVRAVSRLSSKGPSSIDGESRLAGSKTARRFNQASAASARAYSA